MPKTYWWKEVLAPRTYLVPDEKGERRRVKFSAADVKLVAGETARMLKNGVQIPVPFNHDDSAVPVSKKQKLADIVKNNAGEVVDQMLTPDDRFWLKIKVTDAEAAKKIDDGSIKFVSPDIQPHIDCDGETYTPAITHLALTTRPVWHGQAPFSASPDKPVGFDALMGSSAPGQLALGFFDRIRLSMDQVEDEEEPEGSPPKDGDGDGKLGGEEGEEGTPKPSDNKDALLAEVKQLLRDNVGLNLPDDTDPKEFLEHLRVALHALKKPEEGMGPDGKPADLEQEVPMGGYAMGYHKAQNRVAVLESVLAEGHRQKQLTRLQGLLDTGRMAPKHINRHKAKLEGLRFSFDAHGQPESDTALDEILAHAESLPKGAIFDPKERAARFGNDLEEVPPHNPTEMREADGQKILDGVLESMNLKPSRNGAAAH